MAELALAVVDHLISPQLTGPGQLLVRAGGGENPRPQMFGHLHCRAPYPAACRQHEHRLPRLEIGASDQHVPGRPEGHGDGRRRLIGKGGREEHHVRSRRLQVLCIPPIELDADELALQAQVVVARQAVLTAATTDPGIDHHPVAHVDVVDLRPHLGHLPRRFDAQDVGQRRLHPLGPPTSEDVQMVESTGPDPHQHLIGRDLRGGHLLVSQPIHAAALVKDDRLHLALLFPAEINRAPSRQA